jgi:hypothetical protein
MTTISKSKSQDSEREWEYKARPSNGWVWVGAIGLLMLVIAVFLISMIWPSGTTSILTYLPAGVIGLIGVVFLLLAAWFPAIRYEIYADHLAIRYGPVQLYQVDLKQVQKIRLCDLEYSPVSSLRFPGLALYKVHYPNVGVVHMCATSAFHSILLIETPKAKYGLTPADEAGFVTALRKNMAG